MNSKTLKLDSSFLASLLKTYKSISKILIPEEKIFEHICLQKITKPHHIGWKCINCSKTNHSIICNQCFKNSQDNHKGHLFICVPQNNRAHCDCGNIQFLSSDGFCSSHKGIFLTNEEINNYLLHDSKLQRNEIQTIFDLLYLSIKSFVKCYIDTETADQLNTRTYISIQLSMKLNKLCQNNQAIVHILSQFLFEKVKDSYTKHQCIYINQKDYSVEVINQSQENHECICNLFTILVKSFDLIDSEKIIFHCSKNYKLNHYLGLLTFLLFPTFRELLFIKMFCFVGNDVIKIITNNQQYWVILFNNFCNNCKLNLNFQTPNFKKLNEDIQRLACIFELIQSNQSIESESIKYTICTGLIDLLDLLHNYVIFSKENKFNINGKDVSKLNECELTLLLFFESFVSLKSFHKENEQNNLQLLKHLLNKINNKHTIKDLRKNEFSYFICLYKALSIYLTRFAFGISVHNNFEFYESIMYILKQISNYESIFSCIYKYMLKYFKFYISINLGFWKQYDKTTIKSFFLLNLDFSLMKILLGIKIPSIVVNINDILSLETDNDINFLIEEKNSDLSETNKIPNIKHFVLFNCKYIDLLLKIVRNNYCFLFLFMLNRNIFKMFKTKDTVLTQLFSKEKANIVSIQKQFLVVYFIVNNQSSLLFSDIIESWDEIIHEICINYNCFYLQIKSEFLKLFDYSLIIPCNELNAQKFLLTNQTEKMNFLNTIQLTHLNCLQSLQHNIDEQIYNKSTIDIVLKLFVQNCQVNKEYFFLSQFHLLSKFILYMLTLNNSYSNTDKYFIEKVDEHILNKNQVLTIPQINNIYNYIKHQILLNKKIYPYHNNNFINETKLLKLKYQTKYKTIMKTYLNEINNENDNEPICCLCKTIINKNEDNFGYIGYITNDYLMYNMIYKTIKEIYKNHPNQFIFDKQYDKRLKLVFQQKEIRIYNEGSLIHYSCCKYLSTSQKNENKIYIPCISIFYTNSHTNILNSALLFINSIIECKYNGKKQIGNINNECFIEIFSNIFRHYLLLLTSYNCGSDNFKYSQFYILGVIIKSLRVLINENYFHKEFLYSILENKVNEINNEIVWKYLFDENSINKANILEEILFLCVLLEIFNNKTANVNNEKLFPLIWVIRYVYEIYFLYDEVNEAIWKDKLTYNNMKDFYNKNFNLEKSGSSIINHKDKDMKNFFRNIFSFVFLSDQLTSFINIPNQQCLFYKQFTMPNDYPLYINFLNSLNSASYFNQINSHIQYARNHLIQNISFVSVKLIYLSALPFIKPFLISLPKQLFSLYEQTLLNTNIDYNNHRTYCICLNCGQLLHLENFSDYFLNKNNIFNHIEECFGGYGIVCSLKTTQVFIVMKYKFIDLKCCLYKNIKKYKDMFCITSDNVLNEDDYGKVCELFITMNNIIDGNKDF